MSIVGDEQKVKMLLDNDLSIQRATSSVKIMKDYLKDLRFRLLDDLKSDHPLRHPKSSQLEVHSL